MAFVNFDDPLFMSLHTRYVNDLETPDDILPPLSIITFSISGSLTPVKQNDLPMRIFEDFSTSFLMY